MSDTTAYTELLPCPNPECLKSKQKLSMGGVSAVMHWVACATCKTAGPISYERGQARRLWNLLPRQPEGEPAGKLPQGFLRAQVAYVEDNSTMFHKKAESPTPYTTEREPTGEGVGYHCKAFLKPWCDPCDGDDTEQLECPWVQVTVRQTVGQAPDTIPVSREDLEIALLELNYILKYHRPNRWEARELKKVAGAHNRFKQLLGKEV